MIVGEFLQKVSIKKRVAIPSTIRKEFKGNLYLTRGYDNCLVIVDQKMWEKVTLQITEGQLINNLVRDTARFLVGGAKALSPDEQGRFVIPDNLYKYAQLTDKAIFVGLINWVEIWDKDIWQKRVEYLEKNSAQIANDLSNMTRSD